MSDATRPEAAPPADEPPADAPPRPLEPPADPTLAAALAAFEKGDFHAARALLPATPSEHADDVRHHARLQGALAFEPWLAVMAAAGALLWIAAFTWAQ
ncbi:MAG: hypothetical protein H6703_12885 [Myxococcales bacterium]|nr:hypothetical protein [Myxococcales bacterium]MCB9553258.1 hypothetical protein [Myxococcales bacterium]